MFSCSPSLVWSNHCVALTFHPSIAWSATAACVARTSLQYSSSSRTATTATTVRVREKEGPIRFSGCPNSREFPCCRWLRQGQQWSALEHDRRRTRREGRKAHHSRMSVTPHAAHLVKEQWRIKAIRCGAVITTREFISLAAPHLIK